MRKHNVRYDARGVQYTLLVILMCVATMVGTALRVAVNL